MKNSPERVTKMEDRKAREEIVRIGRKMLETGLTRGTGGNLSCRSAGDRIAVSPSAMDYDRITPADVVILSENGKILSGDRKPSSETPLHLELYKSRPETGAVVHTHSTYISVLACLGWEIPPFHYLMASFGGRIPLASYAHFGSRELALSAAATIGEGKAVILANHGLVTVGKTLGEAFAAAETAEFLAEIYFKTRCVGKPRCLDDDQVDRLKNLFENYGRNNGVE
jgi:L-fuculose-phosphate aldolase